MQSYSLYSLLTLGFGLGLLHALDADHVMAVSALASNKRKPRTARSVMLFCARWAVGHGGMLLTLTAVLVFAGLSLPESVTVIAEKAVGLMLVLIGLYIFWTLYTQRVRIAVHTHENVEPDDSADKHVTHMHIAHGDSNEHDHTPVLIGMTHGLAGSAPMLAIVPAMGASSGSMWFALAYVALFSLGVVLAMLVFGLALARVQHWLVHAGQRLFNASRFLIGAISFIFGSYWLFVGH